MVPRTTNYITTCTYFSLHLGSASGGATPTGGQARHCTEGLSPSLPAGKAPRRKRERMQAEFSYAEGREQRRG